MLWVALVVCAGQVSRGFFALVFKSESPEDKTVSLILMTMGLLGVFAVWGAL